MIPSNNFDKAKDMSDADAQKLYAAMRSYRNNHPHSTATVLLHKHLPDPPATVLDLGVGNGEDAETLHDQGYHVIGVDFRDDIAKPSGWEFRLGQAENLPLTDAEVDAVVANRVIHHLPDPTLFYAQALRVLKPGGVIGVVWPDRFTVVTSNPKVTEIVHHWYSTTKADSFTLKSADEVCEDLRNSGFVDIAVQVVEHVSHGTEALGYALGRIENEDTWTTLDEEQRCNIRDFVKNLRNDDGWVKYNLTVVHAYKPR